MGRLKWLIIIPPDNPVLVIGVCGKNVACPALMVRLDKENKPDRGLNPVCNQLVTTEPWKRSCMHACLRPTEAARFCVRKCANNHKLNVDGVQRFLRHAYAARFRVIHSYILYMQNAVCTTCILYNIYENIDWRIFRTWKQLYACMSYTMIKSFYFYGRHF